MPTAGGAEPQQESLSVAIEMARLGQKAEARRILREVCRTNPGDARAWLWSASLAESVPEAVECVTRVLALEPENATARAWYARLRPKLVQVKVYYCFLCSHEEEQEFSQCPQCGSLLSLDIEETLKPRRVDERKVRTAVERLKATENAADSFDTQYFLGVAYLNLADTFSALRHLSRAQQLDERGAELRDVVGRLTKRPLIMAVDDCLTIRVLISSTLERNGYRCLSVASGVDALSYLEEESPRFVLLDVTMPGMDGYTLCKTIKNRPKTKDSVVVMLSARDGFLDKVKGRMAGAADYLTKPFEPALLLRVIRKYLH